MCLIEVFCLKSGLTEPDLCSSSDTHVARLDFVHGVTVLWDAGQALRKGWMHASGGELSLASGTAEGWISVKIFFFSHPF